LKSTLTIRHYMTSGWEWVKRAKTDMHLNIATVKTRGGKSSSVFC